ncbi:hypothetical protein SBA6_40044 [Candidatus Sulfopaludibacter sp. SbA6]|nr:hypothetical protein SBA6_40044 [Candidatus Sulfopaludibacter sp. SbA6]
MLPAIGKYTIEKVLGEGGFGKVYLAFDPDVGQPVAIKKLRAAGDPDLLKRFQLEIRTTASLRHKNIITIHASGEDGGDPYLVMEFLEGHTLKQVIQERRPLTLLEKVRIMAQVAEGLAYAHSKGVVHRDVKPENIMLLPDDNVKIMDFGIALGPDRNTAVTQTGGIIGTPPYFAPEQLEGLKANEQTDIFAFGDVYYELLTGNHPFERFKGDWKSLQLAILTHEPLSVGELVPGCPEALELLVHRTLAKSPEFRYQKFEELQLDSEAILVDLRHEGAAAILREVPPLMESGNLQTAEFKVRQAYKLEPGNREARRLLEEINLLIQRDQKQTRAAKLQADADKQMSEGRYAEAVQTLELAAKLDTTNFVLGARLEEAKTRLDRYVRANRLVSEAVFQQQKGLLTEAQERLQAALAIDPDHTGAIRLYQRVSDELERRRLDQDRQQAMRAAREHLAAKRFAEGLAVLDEIERRQPGAAGVAELRAEIQHEQAEEGRRLRAERFNLALARSREAMQDGDLELAGRMVDHLFANFAAEPGAAGVLPGLRRQLNALIDAREIAQYQQKARDLLREKSFPEALALLAEALRKFRDDQGLERLNKMAEDLYRVHQRSEAIAAALKEATARRDAGDLRGALDTILKGRRDLGDEAAFADLARQLEMEIEQQRYSAGLENLLKEGRELMAGGKYSDAVDRLASAREFSGEAEVHALLDSARPAAAIEEERRFVEVSLAAAGKLESEEEWAQALGAVQRGLARYPHNSSLAQTAERLRDRLEQQHRRALIERHRAMIRLEIEDGEWKRAQAALRKARAELPGDSAFDDLAGRVEAGLYEDGWRKVEARVNQRLAENDLSQAEANLRDQATLTLYAQDPRWKALAQEVVRRREYETALLEADRQRNAGRFSDVETLLTGIINQGPPDNRAGQMRDAIRIERSEALRQAEIARIAEGIRERLKRGDSAQAGPELAAARARYPGESVWTELQAELDARQQALRRQADIAAAEESVRQELGRDHIRQAVALLMAACGKFPGEAVWTTLEDKINARQAVLKQQQHEISAMAESVRRWLSRDHTQADLGAVSLTEMRKALLQRRREDLRPARTELDAARAKYPGEDLWGTLQAAIDARRAFLDAEGEIAERVSHSLERGDLAQAEAQLAAARADYPDEDFWGMFLTEIGRYRGLLQSQAEVARIRESVRDRLKRDDLRGARTSLDAARAKNPNEGIWAILQAEIDARQASLEREAEIADVAESVRGRLDQEIRHVLLDEAEAPPGTYPIAPVWDVLRNVTTRLNQARAKYPGEGIWDVLQAEIAERRARLEREIADIVRACSSLLPLDWNASQLAAARTRYPSEPFWTILEAEIDARREALERASIAEFAARVRERLEQDDLQTALVRLGAARKTHPGARLWDELQAEIDARHARLKRQEELDAVERSVREQLERVVRIPMERDWTNPIELQWEAFQKAAALLAGARAKYPDEYRFAALLAEIGARRAQWQQELSQRIADAIRDHPHKSTVELLGPQINRLGAKDPNEPLWVRLKAEIDALEALLNRQAEVAAAGERVRACVERHDFQQAAAELNAARAKYPGEAQWATLDAEIEARQAREEQRRREARDGDRDRLLTIGRQVETESRKRTRRDLDSEAQRVAAGYAGDPEITAIAARIHARVEAPAAEPVTRKPIPWKRIGITAGAAAAAAAVLLVMLHRKPLPEPRPTPITTIPVEIRTDPQGASVRVGDRSCVTPCRFDLMPGSYQLDAQLKDYEPKQQTVIVDAFNRLVDLTLRPVPLPPPPPGATTGTLVVRTEVPGTLIYVDDVPQPSRTDQSGSATLSLEAKAHEVRVERNQYERPAAKQVRITAGTQQTVVFRLVLQNARLELSGAPANVELRVDGKSLGRADGSPTYLFPAPVKPGDHTLEAGQGLLQAGQRPASRSLTQGFEAGQTVRLAWKAETTTRPTDIGPGTSAGAGTPPVKKLALAPEEIEERDWEGVRDTSDPARLQDFRKKYPNSRHGSDAQSTLDRLLWSNTKKDSLESLRAYLQEFPNGTHASEANSQIADLVWKGVDQSKLDQVRKFAEENPNNPNIRDAQRILDQFNARQEALQKQVLDVLNSFNNLYQRGRSKDLTRIWPNPPDVFLKPAAHTTYELQTAAEPVISGDQAQARVSCLLTTIISQPKSRVPQRVTVQLRNQNGQWLIEKIN